MACDRQGSVIIFNRSMERMVGYEKSEVISKMSLDRFFASGEEEKFKEKLSSREFGGKDRLFLFETTLLSKEGARIPVQLSAAVLFEAEEEIGVVGFFRDLRDLRKLAQDFADQARMLHQDKMISLGKLAASVVHEINNPLSGMLNYARLMLKILGRSALTPESVQKFQSYLTLTEAELSRCSKIVSNLLAFSRKSELEFSELNLNDLLMKCLMLSEHKLKLQNIRIETRLQPDMPAVMGDFNQLQQCVINLIFNAIDAMPEGGVLAIKNCHFHQKNLVEIQVEDTGCGIAGEDLNYIFDPFFTTKKEGKGLGLGLSTVYGIIDRHKGTIKVKSEVGKGSVFTMTLPVS